MSLHCIRYFVSYWQLYPRPTYDVPLLQRAHPGTGEMRLYKGIVLKGPGYVK